MEKPIKGGYILISLGLIALSTSYSGSIDYDRISKTKKRIVLTGIKVADTVMPDITVKPIFGNGTITFEDVYGYDIVVSSNNSVSVSEHTPSVGGSKLFRHYFTNGPKTISLIVNSDKLSGTVKTVGGYVIDSTAGKTGMICNYNEYPPNQKIVLIMFYDKETESMTTETYSVADITFQVTEL